MPRLLLTFGLTAILAGLGLVFPAVVAFLLQPSVSSTGIAVVSVAGVFLLAGLVAIVLGLSRWREFSMPPPVRAVVLGNTLFIAFCALEVSDGLLRQQGRIFYWTTVLLVPALLLHCGLIFAQRWAWWASRGVTALFALWFVVFIAMIPFANLQANAMPTPWYGRLYMIGVTIVFASIAVYAFRSLGSAEARDYFGVSHRSKLFEEKAEPSLDN